MKSHTHLAQDNIFQRHELPFLQNVISLGAGEELVSEYRSVIFYHCGKPEWVETIKVRCMKKEASLMLSDFHCISI